MNEPPKKTPTGGETAAEFAKIIIDNFDLSEQNKIINEVVCILHQTRQLQSERLEKELAYLRDTMPFLQKAITKD